MFKIVSRLSKPNGIVTVSIEEEGPRYSYYTRDISEETATLPDDEVIDYILGVVRDELNPNYIVRLLQSQVLEIKTQNDILDEGLELLTKDVRDIQSMREDIESKLQTLEDIINSYKSEETTNEVASEDTITLEEDSALTES